MCYLLSASLKKKKKNPLILGICEDLLYEYLNSLFSDLSAETLLKDVPSYKAFPFLRAKQTQTDALESAS